MSEILATPVPQPVLDLCDEPGPDATVLTLEEFQAYFADPSTCLVGWHAYWMPDESLESCVRTSAVPEPAWATHVAWYPGTPEYVRDRS